MIKPVFNDVNICLAGNENYSEPMRTMIYSILLHADKSRKYEFIILSHNFSDALKAKFERFISDNVFVRFIDMAEFHKKVDGRGKNYITAETNYRLYLFSKEFAEYDRMLYLDCDMQALDDITKLYDIGLGDKALGVCEDTLIIPQAVMKTAHFFDGKPCNADIYRKKYIGLENEREYFNAGMMLLDLKKCREITDDENAVSVLTAHKMQFNDQDALNIIFKGRTKMLDVRYNYPTPINIKISNKEITKALARVVRNDVFIAHYAGPSKPWNSDVPLGDIYKDNCNQMIKEENNNEN